VDENRRIHSASTGAKVVDQSHDARRDDGADDGARVGAVGQGLHERLVDLDLVERKPLQMRQARIAGAEIIECKPHAESLEPAQRQVGILHRDRLDEPDWLHFYPTGATVRPV
jgi:hypothetical protein